jgi:hypothetical protein
MPVHRSSPPSEVASRPAVAPDCRRRNRTSEPDDEKCTDEPDRETARTNPTDRGQNEPGGPGRSRKMHGRTRRPPPPHARAPRTRGPSPLKKCKTNPRKPWKTNALPSAGPARPGKSRARTRGGDAPEKMPGESEKPWQDNALGLDPRRPHGRAGPHPSLPRPLAGGGCRAAPSPAAGEAGRPSTPSPAAGGGGRGGGCTTRGDAPQNARANPTSPEISMTWP